jgi:hypothetical protein
MVLLRLQKTEMFFHVETNCRKSVPMSLLRLELQGHPIAFIVPERTIVVMQHQLLLKGCMDLLDPEAIPYSCCLNAKHCFNLASMEMNAEISTSLNIISRPQRCYWVLLSRR